MPHLALQRILLPGVDVKTMNSGRVKSGLGKDALVEGGFDSIATIIAPSGGLASAVFVGIPQGYKHIQIRGIGQRSTGDSADGQSIIRFNNDTANNYSGHGMYGNGGGGVNTLAYANSGGSFPYGTPGANSGMFNGNIIDILDYSSTTKNKTMRWAMGFNNNGGAADTEITSTAYYSLAPITRIDLSPADGVWSQYSHFALYGIR